MKSFGIVQKNFHLIWLTAAQTVEWAGCIGKFAQTEPVKKDFNPGNTKLMADSCIVSDSGTDGKTVNLVMIVQYTKIDLARLFRMKYQIQSFHGIGWKGKSPAKIIARADRNVTEGNQA